MFPHLLGKRHGLAFLFRPLYQWFYLIDARFTNVNPMTAIMAESNIPNQPGTKGESAGFVVNAVDRHCDATFGACFVSRPAVSALRCFAIS